MLILGIETSCDETAFGLVEDGILRDAIMASQADVHALFGGVVPEMASREHYRVLGPLFDDFMIKAGKYAADLDAVAVTRGPGLLGSLLVGVAFAKALAFGADIPLIGVDHLKAHLLAAGLEQDLPLPALGLLWFATFGPFHAHGGMEGALHAAMMVAGGLLLAAAHLTNLRLTHQHGLAAD